MATARHPVGGRRANRRTVRRGLLAETAPMDCDEGGPPRWDAQRVIEERARGGPRKRKRVAVPLSPAIRRRLTRTRPVAVRAVVQPGGSAGAKLVVEHDNAAGGV